MLARAAPKKQKMMWEALREATDEEMEKDPTVCVIGVASSMFCHSIATNLKSLRNVAPILPQRLQEHQKKNFKAIHNCLKTHNSAYGIGVETWMLCLSCVW